MGSFASQSAQLIVITFYMLAHTRSFASALRLPNIFSIARPLRNPLSMSIPKPKTVIVIAGATSVGKSSVAMQLCKEIGAEIVISDAVQVYSHLDIGSNKPTQEDRDAVPHHLLDICHPSTVMTTGDYYRKAAASIMDIIERGKTPVVVGGSTMWVQWLVQGIPDAPKPDAAIASQAEELLKDFRDAEQWEAGLAVLRQYDNDRAEKLSRNDWYRLQRSLEIALQLRGAPATTGTEGAEDSAQEGPLLTGTRTKLLPEDIDMRTVFIAEERELLYHTIDSLCVDMLHLGHIREVAELLLNDTLVPEYTVAKSIGYRQTIAYLARTALASEAKERTPEEELDDFIAYLDDFCTTTRNYAKRQLNWYRKDKNFLFVRSRRQFLEKEAAYRKTAEEVLHWATAPRADFDAALSNQLSLNDALTELRARSRVPPSYLPDTHERRLALSWLINKGEVRVPTEADLAAAAAVVASSEEGLSKSAKKRIARLKFLAAKKAGKAGAEEEDVAEVEEPAFAAGAQEPSVEALFGTDGEDTAVPAPVEKRTLPAWATSIVDEYQGITPDLLKKWHPELSAAVPDVRATLVWEKMRTYKSRVTAPECFPLYEELVEEAIMWRSLLLAEKRDLLVRFLKEEEK